MVTRPEIQLAGPRPTAAEAALAHIAEALARVGFGEIRLTIHEGRLVQIDVTERTRFSQG
jgi:hypothetical protein